MLHRVYEYRISVIVPVYNEERYLRDCLDSLLRQTIDQRDLEVLMVDDGSTDSSASICKEYADSHSNFFYYYKDNGGLSSTRNYGIKHAHGKYISYLDSDDQYSEETLKNVCDFFDAHYDEIDEVTFPIVRYKEGTTFKPHYRYRYLTKTGVYDLNEFPFACQTNICICVKNLEEDNVLFDTTPNFRHEDLAYNNEILGEKLKIGFVKEAEYKYNRNNVTSIINTYMYPYYIFETTIGYFEKLFSKYERVPRYFQALLISDFTWKLRDDKLFPFHYEPEQFAEALNRIKNLLAKCDVYVITHFPELETFHIHYWLKMKPNVFPVVLSQRKLHTINAEGRRLYRKEKMEIIMHKVRVKNGRLRMLAFVKSPVYNYIEEPANVWVVENGKNRKKLEVFPSVHGYFRNQFTYTNNFWAFDYYCDVKSINEFYFEVELDGIIYNTSFWCMPVAVFDTKAGRNSYIRENTKITLQNNKILLTSVTAEETYKFEIEATNKYSSQKEVFDLRKQSLDYRKKHNIWLYSDWYTVKEDNGLYQFKNDIKHCEEDGIERYYVITNEETRQLLSDEEKKHTVVFGSDRHKLLYLSAKKVLSAFFGLSPISPFGSEEEEFKYSDIIKFEIVYLQHGVLHAALRTYNAVEKCRAEKIVVSSQFEVDNYMRNYHYTREDLIASGMPRYDQIDFKCEPKKRILYAPSWRKYLTVSSGPSNWEVVESKLRESEYFQNMLAFISDPELLRVLEEKDYYLEIKPHPIIAGNKDLFKTNSDRIVLAKENVKVEEYSMFITDFSSFVFDFAPLKRPILYFVPDYLQFKSGMNHYKELDLPFDKAFGPFTTKPDEAANTVVRILNNDCKPEEIYSDRMDKFFVDLNNCSEHLYQELMRD